MSSPFTMLAMLSKARRGSSKRKEASQDSATSTPASTTTPLPSLDSALSQSASTPATSVAPTAPSTTAGTDSDFDLSDSASIISKSSITKKPKKRRSPSSLFRGLSISRKSSTGSIVIPSQPHGTQAGHAILSPIMASPIDGPGFTNEPESIDARQGLAKKASSDGFSVVSRDEDGEEAGREAGKRRDEGGDKDHEGGWTEVVDAFPSPPATIPLPSPTLAVATGTGTNEELNSLSFNDAEELTSAEEELKKATENVKALEGKLIEHEAEKRRMEEVMRDARTEKGRLENMLRGIEQKLKEVEDRCNGEQKEKERLGRELLRVREENDRLTQSLHAQAAAVQALEDRYAQIDAERANLEANFRQLNEEKEKLAAKARADADALKETKARHARQELEKGGLKAELQSISREKEATSLKLFSITQQLDDMRQNWETSIARATLLEDQAKELESEATRLREQLLARTSEKEQFATEAKETQEELDHLYQRYAEQDDELNRLKDELQKTTSRGADTAQAAREAKAEGDAFKAKMAEMEKEWHEERVQLARELAAERLASKHDVQKATAIAQELVKSVRELQHHTTVLREEAATKESEWDEERKRLSENHADEIRKLAEEGREKAAEERDRLLQEHEGEMKRLYEEKNQDGIQHGRELAAVRAHLVQEHTMGMTKLKDDLERALKDRDTEKALARRYAEERNELKAEKANREVWWIAEEKDRRIVEQKSKYAYDKLALEFRHEKAGRNNDKMAAEKAMKEQQSVADNELAKANEALRMKEASILELQGELTRALRAEGDIRNWQVKAEDAMEESARLRQTIERMSRHTETGPRDLVFDDQAKRQSSEIHFSRPSSSRRGSAETIEPLDAAVSVLYALNSEIFQAAASLADTVEVETRFEGIESTGFDKLLEKVAPFLSEELVVSLRSAYSDSSDGPNPLLLQVAFQACLAYCCNRFIKSWYPLHWDYGRFLEVLHGRLVDAGANSEADSWRSTTRALLRLTSESHPQMASYLHDSVLDILAIIGRSTAGRATEDMLARFQEKFSVIARLAIRMHILFSDTPSNLETFLVQPGTAFSSDVMEDTYADDDEDDTYMTDVRLRDVICTAEIGLQRTAIRDEVDRDVILKPKVILAAVLNQEW